MHITDVSLYGLWLKEKRHLSEGSIHVYKEVVSRFLSSNPDLVSLESYNNFIVMGGVKKRCYHYYSAIKAFIEFKISDASLKNRLIGGLVKSRLRQNVLMERKYLTEEQIVSVINNLEEPKHQIIALIQTLTGVRAGDVLRLKRDNIFPEEYKGKNVLRLNITGKGGKRNVIFIHDPIAQEIILDYITQVYNHDDYYFIELGKLPHRQGDITNEFMMYRMNYMWFWRDLKQALKLEGLDMKDFSTHDFRRCFARRAWEKWKDVHVLQSLLNHSNPAVTLKYLEQSGMKNVDHHYIMQMGEDDTQ